MSKRCPKKPHSLQSDISMFRVQHWQLPIITHMVLFDLTDFYCEYKYNTIIIRRAPPGTITLLIAGIYMCVSPRYHFTNEFIKTSNESTKLPIGWKQKSPEGVSLLFNSINFHLLGINLLWKSGQICSHFKEHYWSSKTYFNYCYWILSH